MNNTELQALRSQGEGLHLEFKESINSGLAKEIVAFANTKGGMLLIGVDDDGGIKNKVLSNGDRSKIQDISRECDPSIDISIETVDEQENVLIVHVKEGLNKPYRCSTGFYAREGASSVKRKTHEIHEMFRDEGRFSFDDILCLKADFEKEFEPRLLKRFFREAGKEQILSDEDTLHNLGVLEFVDGKPILNNTGVLFFSKNPSFFLPQAIIQCVRYKGNIKVDIEDQKDMTFDVMTNIDECFSFLRRSLDVGFTFETGDPRRKEVWEIPFVALREAIINAFAHRDYVNKGTHIQVEVFDDRVSITNFGGLVKGFSLDDLGKRSAHRNPNMVNIFHRANFIEKLGTGILRINEELELAGHPAIEFDVNEYWFTIIFSRKNVIQSGQIQSGQKQSGSRNFILNEQEMKILSFCKLKPKSRSEIFTFIGMSNETRNFTRNVLPLLEKEYLNMTEPDSPRSRNQKYYATDLGIKTLEALNDH
jgi:ATP-dependent DNA helicase RecG